MTDGDSTEVWSISTNKVARPAVGTGRIRLDSIVADTRKITE